MSAIDKAIREIQNDENRAINFRNYAVRQLEKLKLATEAEKKEAVKAALEKVRTEISKLNKSANDYYKTYAEIGEDKHAEYWRGQAKGTFDAIKRLNDVARLLSESYATAEESKQSRQSAR